MPTPPTHLQLVLSDLCNQSCSFCSYRDPGYMSSKLFHVAGNYNPNRMLSTEKAREVIGDFYEMGGRAVQFTGGGEPTVHPEFFSLATWVARLGMKWGLITNGVRHAVVPAGASWIRVSVDAATPATYAKIRRVPEGHFDKALAAIARWRCGAGFVVTEDNWREVHDAVKLFKGLGASNVRIAPQFTEAAGYPSFYAAALGLVNEAIKEETPEFRVYSRFVDKLDEVQRAPTERLCGYQYFTTYVGADENLYRCCVYAYNPHGLLGSLKDRRFRDVWPEVAAGFRAFDATKCRGCHYQDINRVLAYALDPAPTPDEEFV